MITKILTKPFIPNSTFSQTIRTTFSSQNARPNDDASKILNSSPTKIVPSDGSISSRDEIRAKELTLSAFFLIRYYRTRGHELAHLDPLSTHVKI